MCIVPAVSTSTKRTTFNQDGDRVLSWGRILLLCRNPGVLRDFTEHIEVRGAPERAHCSGDVTSFWESLRESNGPGSDPNWAFDTLVFDAISVDGKDPYLTIESVRSKLRELGVEPLEREEEISDPFTLLAAVACRDFGESGLACVFWLTPGYDTDADYKPFHRVPYQELIFVRYPLQDMCVWDRADRLRA